MSTASNLYALSLDQCADLITHIGPERTVVVQGDMGSGKTSGLRKLLSERHPKHIYVECDCTNKDVQDLSVPKFMQRVGDMISDYVEFVPNSELGAHLGKPVIINFDEFLKAPEPVKKGVRRIMLERMVNGIKLPEGSIVYGTV
jgi:ABC-type ATPase involved in cell division